MNSAELTMLLKSPRRAAVAALGGGGNISRIVPVAWPLLKSEWDVVITVNESVGLVDRFILRALRDSGPCTVQQLDALLCLGEDRTTAALAEMARVGAPIQKKGLQYSVPAEVEIESFKTEHEHRFAFLLNGLTGDLLPSSFLDRARNIIFPGNDSASILDRAKRIVFSESDLAKMPWILQLRPILTGSESPALRKLNPSNVLKLSESAGMPTGFKEFCTDVPRRELTLFVLGFLFIDMAGNGLLLAATSEADEITLPNGYLSEIPRMRDMLFPVPDATLQKLNGDRIRFSRIDPKRNVLSVSVSDVTTFSKPECDENYDFANHVAMRLLRSNWLWCRKPDTVQFAYFDLRAANVEMEKYLIVQKAITAISYALDDISDRMSFERWIKEFLSKTDALSSVRNIPAFSNLVTVALERSAKGELRVLANRIKLSSGILSDNRRSASRSFLDSSDKGFGNHIVDMVRKAKCSVFIVSPVIQEDGVFEALREAVSKGVEIRVVTQLGDHRTGRFVTSPEFADYDIPRRRLAELGACVRDWDVTVHAKMILVDGENFLFSTANLNENSLGTGKQNAVEAAVLFERGQEVAAGQRLFDAIWEGCPTRQEKRDDRISIARIASKARLPTAGDCSVRAGTTEFLLSTPLNRLLARRLTTLLNMAKSKIVFLAMSIYDLEKVPVLFDAFMRALSRKVDVTVFVRTGVEQFKPSEWPDPSTKKLMTHGLKIVEIPRLHAKGVFVDDEIGIMMSANLNPYSLGDLETSHVEVAVQASCAEPFMAKYRDFALTLLGH